MNSMYDFSHGKAYDEDNIAYRFEVFPDGTGSGDFRLDVTPKGGATVNLYVTPMDIFALGEWFTMVAKVIGVEVKELDSNG